MVASTARGQATKEDAEDTPEPRVPQGRVGLFGFVSAVLENYKRSTVFAAFVFF